MLISEVYTRVYDFVVLAINDPLVTVIFANQNAPRPKKPFIIIQVGGLKEVSMPMKYEIDDNGIQNIVSNMSFIITFNSYCDVLHQAEELLNLLQRKFRTDLAYNHFKADIAYMRTIMGVSALPVAIGGINESRAIFEAEFSLTQSLLDDVGLIEHIHITDETTGDKLIINK
jgi:hypothetical protein